MAAMATKPPPPLPESLLLALVRLAAGRKWCPKRASLQTEEVKAIFDLPSFKNCDIEFHAECVSIGFPSPLLSLPLHRDEEIAQQGIQPITPLPDTGRLSDSLRVIVASLLPHRGPPSAKEAAGMVGVSRVTLFRRLAKEGTTYKELVERVRYQAAQHLLRDRDLAVKEIGFLLGYSVPQNFIRAFRNISGVTPATFRRQHAQA